MKNKLLRWCFILAIFCFGFLFATDVSSNPVKAENKQKLVDDADLLSSSEKEHIEALLMRLSKENQFDIVIHTLNDPTLPDTDEALMNYADDYYDYNGYGYGENYDGVILVINMAHRGYWISTCGYGITAMTDRGLEYMKDQFVPSMSDGDYAEAFEIFANTCDDFVKQAKSGKPYDVGNLPKKDLGFIHILIALGIGAVAAAIACLTMKGQLNTIHPKNHAADYMIKDSLNITQSTDQFLYVFTKKTAKPKNNGGGSSTHHSSSGRSHGGSGGHF
ncbi:MAG: TPM domain-containing protein [Eubacterium sp.]|nr:TPM domain-containing protein [Eubacterium sp.]